METTERLNAIVDYIEHHITDDIDANQLAKIACCSVYDVNRMFLLVADISIAEYIRKRRMTLAGCDIKYHASKVIDAALKYGYDSPVSFTRAFFWFHGVNPGEVTKRNVVLKTFPRLIFKISVKPVAEMIQKETMLVDGKAYEASYFGGIDISSWSDTYCKRQYWRLEHTGDDFRQVNKCLDVLPYNNYPPIEIEVGQVFVIRYTKKDGECETNYYIADGSIWNNMICTREFVLNP